MPRMLFITTEKFHATSGATFSIAALLRALADSEATDLSVIEPLLDGLLPVREFASTSWMSQHNNWKALINDQIKGAA